MKEYTMREFERKRKMESTLYSPAVIVVLIILIIFIGHSVLSAYQKSEYSTQEADRLQARLESLKTEKEKLANSYKFINTKEGIEAELRSKYRVASRGEKVAIIIDTPKTDSGKVLNKVKEMDESVSKEGSNEEFVPWWKSILQSVGISTY